MLFSANIALGWSVTRRIGFDQGEDGVTHGRLRRVVDSVGNHIGYQPVEEAASIAPPSSDTSRSSLMRPEMHANAGLYGASRSAVLRQQMLRERVYAQRDALMLEMDFVEATRMKVNAWHVSANHHGDRAVRVYPKQAPVWA